MIKREFYMEREDGVKLFKSYSDKSVMIEKNQTGETYSEAIDVEDAPFTYKETSTPIDPSEEAEIEDYQDALNYLATGGDQND